MSKHSEFSPVHISKTIFSYPTLQYFKSGVAQYNYEAPVSSESLSDFLRAPSKEKASKPARWT